jgi:multidrug resistance efflux pump
VIAFLTLCYSLVVWLVFIKLKLLPWNRGSQAAVAGIGVVGILALVISMNLYQPYSADLRVYQYVVQIVPRVTGRVVDVPIRANQPIRQGDILFRIDPEPFEYQVARLEADLKIKGRILEDVKALTGARVAAEIKRAVAQADHDMTLASLEEARWKLRETTVTAPHDGVVTQLGLGVGDTASEMASLPVMTFVQSDQRVMIATFPQSALKFVREGDPVEMALKRYPGEILTGRVEAIIPATGQGQLEPSGTLLEWTEPEAPGLFAVRLKLDAASHHLEPEAGAAGVAAIYTEGGKAIRIIRKVVMRMQTWLDYVIL